MCVCSTLFSNQPRIHKKGQLILAGWMDSGGAQGVRECISFGRRGESTMLSSNTRTTDDVRRHYDLVVKNIKLIESGALNYVFAAWDNQYQPLIETKKISTSRISQVLAF